MQAVDLNKAILKRSNLKRAEFTAVSFLETEVERKNLQTASLKDSGAE